MKAGLALIALALALVMALAMDNLAKEPDPTRVFSETEQIAIEESLPGGRWIKQDTLYRRCENQKGHDAHQGVWVYYALNGQRYTYSEGCWR